MPGRQTRAERAAHPLARDSVRRIAESLGRAGDRSSCAAPTQ
jgi:hypothetical protein